MPENAQTIQRDRRDAFRFRYENVFSKINNWFIRLFVANMADFFIAYSKRASAFLVEELGVSEKSVYYIPKAKEDYSKIPLDKEMIISIRKKYFAEGKKNILLI